LAVFVVGRVCCWPSLLLVEFVVGRVDKIARVSNNTTDFLLDNNNPADNNNKKKEQVSKFPSFAAVSFILCGC